VLPNGYAIEIEDRGLGMSPEAIEAANRRLVEPPDFDPANSARLGLFVVAQLAHRHGIRISLRPSAFGGVTAIALLPGELITSGAGPIALPAGPSPADRAWDRPLVGTGTDDPSRHSLAALQWQGAGELRSITVPGRHVTINGTATAGPVGGEAIPRQRNRMGRPQRAGTGGPTPSAIVEGLSADGLVQRRRTVPRRAPEPSADRTLPEQLAAAAAALAPSSPAPPVGTPTDELPGTAPADELSADDGLPRRIRQASLAPQLREPVEAQPDAGPVRSPEEVRNLMTALQRGTKRGRLAARGIDPDSSDASSTAPAANGTPSFAEAATVTLPVVQNRAEPPGNDAPVTDGEAGSPEASGSTDAVDGNHPDEDHETRPDKDA
jgi:hypothetical protein